VLNDIPFVIEDEVSVRRMSVAQDGFDRPEGADLKAAIEIRDSPDLCGNRVGIDGAGGEASKSSSRRSVKRYSTL
jgi:hypothetical protein